MQPTMRLERTAQRLRSAASRSTTDGTQQENSAGGLELTDVHYDVAISFAGEDRTIAEDIAQNLDVAGFAVFYDDFEADRLWGADLPVELGRIYSERARYCVMVVSRFYVAKMWTNHERQFAISRMMKGRDGYVLPIRVDESAVPGLPPGIGYLSLAKHSLSDIHRLLLKKLGKPIAKKQPSDLPSGDLERAQEVLGVSNRRAIFTRMDGEIDLEAMFSSIAHCISELQRIGPSFESSELQYLTLELVRELDTLDRFRLETERARLSIGLPTATRARIDLQKERVVRAIHRIRRAAGASVQLPTELGHHHFFDLRGADAPAGG